MNEELDLLMSEAENGMNSAIERLKLELTKIRAGRATPSMLDTVKVDYLSLIHI